MASDLVSIQFSLTETDADLNDGKNDSNFQSEEKISFLFRTIRRKFSGSWKIGRLLPSIVNDRVERT
jgi:hypothetical protein